MIYALLLILLLAWVFADYIQPRLFIFGILSAFLISLFDFYLKYTNDRPSDLEGFAVMNLEIGLLYVLIGMAFFLLIAVLENFKKASLFLVIFVIFALLDFYFLGSYRITINEKYSTRIEKSAERKLLNSKYKPNKTSISIHSKKIELISVQTENRRIIKTGLFGIKDTSIVPNYYLLIFVRNPNQANLKFYCTIGQYNLESFGRINHSDLNYEVYNLQLPQTHQELDSLKVLVKIDNTLKSFTISK